MVSNPTINVFGYCEICGTEQVMRASYTDTICGSRNHKWHRVNLFTCSTVGHVRKEPVGRSDDGCDLPRLSAP